MKTLTLKFAKETDPERAIEQQNVINKLTIKLPKLLRKMGYNDVNLVIKISSQTTYDIAGFKPTDKKIFLTKIEDIFNDDTLLID
ncbi:hypothetical protein [Gallibacterium anatis]|uniref:hypothetical protein n=1 Tax=Gallibacterium anatis TaxID=750 RepID=UPI0030062FC9